MISDRAYLAWANNDFETGAKVAIAEFLREMESRGVNLGEFDTLIELIEELDG